MSTDIETDYTVTYEGKTFEAGGAVITDDYIIGYGNWPGQLGE